MLTKAFDILHELELLYGREDLLVGFVVLPGLANASVPSAECGPVDFVLVSILLVYKFLSKFLRFDCCKRIINWCHIGGVVARQKVWLVCCFGVRRARCDSVHAAHGHVTGIDKQPHVAVLCCGLPRVRTPRGQQAETIHDRRQNYQFFL